MKKIISIVLMLALCLSLFAGCDLSQYIPGLNNGEDGLEKAKQYLNNYFQGSDAKTATDYQVPGIILIDGVTYNVEWTTDVEAIVVTRLENNMVQIDLPELASEKVDYVLTATVSDADGKTITYSVNREIPKSDSVGKNDEQIVEEAYTLPSYNSYDKTSGQYKDKDGNVIEGTVVLEGVTVTGVVKSIRIPYDAGYNNITVIIQVGDLADKPIDCYRLTGDGIADLAPGDTVTIQGTLANYQGTVQFAAASVAMAIEKGPEVTCPATPAEILTAAKALEEGWSLPYKSTMTGVVTEITSAYAANYMNLTCNIEVDGNKIICYRLLGELGANLKVGDTITVTGYLMNYKGDLEYGQGCTLDSLVPSEGGETPDTPVTPETPSAELPPITAPVADTAYKFGLFQVKNGTTLYITGEISSSRYLSTTTDKAAAVDVYVEVVDGGYKFYILVDGAKSYIEAYKNDSNKDALRFSENGSVFTYKASIGSWVTNIADGEERYLGTYGTYDTISSSWSGHCTTTNVGVDQFPAGFFSTEADENPGENEDPTTPENPTTPAEPENVTILEALAIAKAQESAVYTAGKYYITGVISEVTDASKGNFIIRDENGNLLTVYGSFNADGTVGYADMTEKPAAGDTVTVLGVLGNYYGAPQTKDAWITEYTLHTCSYSEATCTDASKCALCGDVKAPALGHTVEVGVCGNCGKTLSAPVTVSKNIADLITANGWTDKTTKQSFNLDNVVSVKVDGGSNSGKAYSGNHIRIYATDSPAGTLTISVPEGYELVSVKVSAQTGTYAFLYVDGGSTDISNVSTAVSGNSVVLKSVKNGSDGKQVRVTGIEVVYKANG